ncbi:MAG: hypothetical protein QOH52_282 [Pseudonocardiales bacterium]|jgi:hypothetical protein|nr:hypothetical protein [Pseudonocardiales bacterium]
MQRTDSASRVSAALRDRIVRPARRRVARLWTQFPGEIVGDDFAAWIEKLAADPSVRTMVEVGSGAGDGSTRAFVNGAVKQANPPALFCIETSASRADELRKRYADKPFVHTYRAASVGPDQYMSEQDALAWHRAFGARTRTKNTEESILATRTWELTAFDEPGFKSNAVEMIRADHGVTHFDVALLDGSRYTGAADLRQVYGARWLLLDDILNMKNQPNGMSLVFDPNYKLVHADQRTRDGFAVFERVGSDADIAEHQQAGVAARS